MNWLRWWGGFSSWAIIGGLSLPILMIFYDLFHDFFTVDHLMPMGVWRLLLNSLALSLGVALLSSFFGLLLGLLWFKSNIALGWLMGRIVWVSFLIPPYILAFSWLLLFRQEGGLEVLFSGFWGTLFILFWVYLPISLLLIERFLSQIDPDLESSALLITNWWGVLYRVTIPLLLPALKVSFWLIFMLTFGEITVANVLRYPVFAMESFTQFSAFYDTQMATLMALPIMMVALLLQWQIRKGLTVRWLRWRAVPSLSIKFGLLTRWLLGGFSWMVVLLSLFPLFNLVSLIDVGSFFEALDRGTWALFLSFRDAILGSTLVVLWGVILAYLFYKELVWGANFLKGVLLLGFILPSSIMGMGLILFWNQPWSMMIYGGFWIIILGYLGKYLFLGTQIIEMGLSQSPSSLEEAAILSGASWWQTLCRILIPLHWRTLFLAWLVGFLFMMRESSMTMLVHPAGEETLPVYILTQMANGDPKVTASLSLLMVLGVIVPFVVYLFYERRGRSD